MTKIGQIGVENLRTHPTMATYDLLQNLVHSVNQRQAVLITTPQISQQPFTHFTLKASL